MKFSRVWAMPSRDTLSVPEMRDFARQFTMHSKASIDPFARNCRLATVTNDLNPDTAAQHHMDAEEFPLSMAGRTFDVAIFDPPYSPRQVSECYQQVGLETSMQDTQAGAWARWRDALDPLIVPGGVVVSYGWNSNGMGKGRGYELIEMLIVAHGGMHNDTICIAERKLQPAAQLFQMEAA